ncbi:pyrroline-5-carboxylate reductase [Moraxella nasibovis]|uniref:pyrroline-5-carboxylate reductase n=1 Tax=Moraxella nasibovis TaxID=2904120 RepID=UPI00240FCE0C|nr:pyrroline-5-carboxylate reductase [Moraxella nasibovis]WFF38456.1 pyrroline-5-carboxylate reductase [Moraxella nasibovis]
MNSLTHKKIAFIGGGNMANAIIDGLLKVKKEQGLAFDVLVSDDNESKRASFIAKGVQAVAPDDAYLIIRDADVVVLAVKPQVMSEVCQEIRSYLSGQLVLSVAAGLSVATLTKMLGGYDKIVRSMPNLPSSIGLGATGLFASQVSDDDKAVASDIMRASGLVAWLDDEEQMHAVTAVAGSAPAYFFYVLENMIEQAVAMGLPPEQAKSLAIQSLIGAGELAKTADPAVLRTQVTSKGGTTAAALSVFAEQGMGQILQDGMKACAHRSRELGELLGQDAS